METKKSRHADLETKKNIFLQVGLIIALSIVLVAFEWKSPVSRILTLDTRKPVTWIDEKTDITQQEPPKPKPVPPSFTRIEIIDNNIESPEYVVPDAGTNEKELVPEYIPTIAAKIADESAIDDPDEIFKVVESMPEFPGGLEAMRKFLGENIVYPDEAKSANIQGTVYLSFVVEKDGSITHIKVERGDGGGLSEESVRVLKMMPRWTPGLQRTKPVRVSFYIPIEFKLN